MKKKSMIALLFFGSILSLTFVAASDPTIVTGIVYQEDSSNSQPGIPVTVTCNNTVDVTEKDDVTDDTGMYAVEFTPNECSPGNMVRICEENTDNCVDAEVTDTEFWKNIVYKDFDVPELSWTAATLALIGAGLGFMLLRKSK